MSVRGVRHVSSGLVATIYTKSNLGSRENPCCAEFAEYACGNRVDLPHVARRAFGNQMGPNRQKAMPFGTPSSTDKKMGLSHFLFFDRAHRGVFGGSHAVGHIS